MPTPLVHIIDDDHAARDFLAFLLSANDFAVRSYEAAKSFLSKARWAAGGCVITDIRMPEMDGLELIRQLKSCRIGFPVIAVTGQGDVPLAIEAIQQGAVDFIEKPFNDAVVLAAVRRPQHAGSGLGEACDSQEIGGTFASRTAGPR